MEEKKKEEFNIMRSYVLDNGKIRLHPAHFRIEFMGLRKDEQIPAWIMQPPGEILKLIEDGIKFRKLKEAKKIQE